MYNFRKWILSITVAFVIVASDLVSKFLIMNFMLDKPPLIINDFLRIVSVQNKGISFSMFANSEYDARYYLIFLSFVIIMIILFWIRNESNFFKVFSLSLVLGGAFGNMIDRICNGSVFDFIDFHIGKYHWPAFNVADSAICIGVSLLVIDSFISITNGKGDEDNTNEKNE